MPQRSEATRTTAGVDEEKVAFRALEGVVGGTRHSFPNRPQPLDHGSSGRQLVSRGMLRDEADDVESCDFDYTIFSSCPARFEAVTNVAGHQPTENVAFPWRGSFMSSRGAASSQVDLGRHGLALHPDHRARQNGAMLSALSVGQKRRLDVDGVQPAARETVDISNAQQIWSSATPEGIQDVAVSGSPSATGHPGPTPALESAGDPRCRTNGVNYGGPTAPSATNGEVPETHDLYQIPSANDVSHATDSAARGVEPTTGIDWGHMISNGRRIEWLGAMAGSSGKHRLIHRSSSGGRTDREGFKTPASTEEGSSSGWVSSGSSVRGGNPWWSTPGCCSLSFESESDENDKGDLSAGRLSSMQHHAGSLDVLGGDGHVAVTAPGREGETEADMRRRRWQEATGIYASGRGLMY